MINKRPADKAGLKKDNMKKEVKKIMEKGESFKEELSRLIAENPSKKDEIVSCVESELKSRTARLDKDMQDITIRMQLADVISILPLSYIAEKYFNKSRAWLYQRINGNTVNGKSAKFTDKEIKTLNFAIKDISEKLGSVNIV